MEGWGCFIYLASGNQKNRPFGLLPSHKSTNNCMRKAQRPKEPSLWFVTTTEINYKGTDYTCRIVTSNEGESLIIGGLELLDVLMPYPITDKCNGFANKEAERVDEEIFFYTSESDLKLPDNELVAILSESNPDWFD